MLRRGDCVGLVCCSDGLPMEQYPLVRETRWKLKKLGIFSKESPYLFQKDGLAPGTIEERAGVLSEFYRDPEIRCIFDISGGNLANQLLDVLDYKLIASAGKPFWGYSDLTVLLNGIYARTGQVSWLYQIKNLVRQEGESQMYMWKKYLNSGEEADIMPKKWIFLQGNSMEGIVVGGNIRCFLKLAGTPYFPDMQDKILLLESLGGDVGVISSLLTQMRQMGIFQKIKGILIGTFTYLDKNYGKEMIEYLMQEVLENCEIPVARTSQVGHGADSCAFPVGKKIKIADEFMNF